jgi:hypothetical protein
MQQVAKSGEAAIKAMLARFANAFTHGDGKGAAACWEVPALIVSDEGTRAVSALSEIEAFFGNAAGQYNAKGVTSTRPEIQTLNWLTQKLATVQVRWPYLDARGVDLREAESSMYVLRTDAAGEPKICASVMLGAGKD